VVRQAEWRSSGQLSQAPEIRIPPRYTDSLRALRDLPEEAAERLLSALELGAPIVTPSKLLASLADKLPELDPDKASSLLDALLSLNAFRTSHSFPIDDVAKAVSVANGLREDGVDSTQFAHRLAKVLGAATLTLTAKALDVSAADERIYHSCRIVTDVRPIFGDDPSKPPVSAVIVHSLQVTYYKDNRIESTHVALDDDDLMKLKEVVDRASSKAASLRSFLESAGLTPADIEGE
jgi:hypothetical protein